MSLPILSRSESGRNPPLARDGMASSESARAEPDQHPPGQPATGPGPTVTVGRRPGGEVCNGDEGERDVARARGAPRSRPAHFDPPTLARASAAGGFERWPRSRAAGAGLDFGRPGGC